MGSRDCSAAPGGQQPAAACGGQLRALVCGAQQPLAVPAAGGQQLPRVAGFAAVPGLPPASCEAAVVDGAWASVMGRMTTSTLRLSLRPWPSISATLRASIHSASLRGGGGVKRFGEERCGESICRDVLLVGWRRVRGKGDEIALVVLVAPLLNLSKLGRHTRGFVLKGLKGRVGRQRQTHNLGRKLNGEKLCKNRRNVIFFSLYLSKVQHCVGVRMEKREEGGGGRDHITQRAKMRDAKPV